MWPNIFDHAKGKISLLTIITIEPQSKYFERGQNFYELADGLLGIYHKYVLKYVLNFGSHIDIC